MLKDCFRLLWEQHIYWTRMVIMGIAFDLPDLPATTNRLLRNPSDYGRIFCRYYGKEIAAEVERLITAHLVIAADLVKAAKAGNIQAATVAEKRWYENADEIVNFLTHINPCWSFDRMKAMWYEHLALTKEEAVAELTKKYTRSIAMFNRVEQEAMMMADDFACGFTGQFNL
jgi:hypothetical protein